MVQYDEQEARFDDREVCQGCRVSDFLANVPSNRPPNPPLHAAAKPPRQNNDHSALWEGFTKCHQYLIVENVWRNFGNQIAHHV